MQNGDGSAGRKGGHPIGIGGALLIGGLAWWMERKQDRDHPEAVSLGSKSKLVLDLARELALQSREDNAAVAELVAIARGKRRRLRRARHASKFCGFHHEHWHANRVYRLLDAACLDEPVAAVSGEDRQRIQEVEAMMALPLAQRWELLVEREPRLLQLENEVRFGMFGPLQAADRGRAIKTGETLIGPDGSAMARVRLSDEPFTENERQELRETANNSLRLNRRLAKLLGPDSGQHDLLLGSMRAQQTAASHLSRLPE